MKFPNQSHKVRLFGMVERNTRETKIHGENMWIEVIDDACVTAPINTRGKVGEQFQPDARIAAVLFGNESQIFEMR